MTFNIQLLFSWIRNSYQQGFISSWKCNKCTWRWKKTKRRRTCALSW